MNNSQNKKRIVNGNIASQVLNNVQMDTQTSFMANGDINIYPCSWEDDKAPVTQTGKRIRYRGGIEVDEDGRTRVKRFRDGLNGPKYEMLYRSAHGDVKRTREDGSRSGHKERGCLKVVFTFPKRYPLALMKDLFYQETEEVIAYLNSRKEVTLW